MCALSPLSRQANWLWTNNRPLGSARNYQNCFWMMDCNLITFHLHHSFSPSYSVTLSLRAIHPTASPFLGIVFPCGSSTVPMLSHGIRSIENMIAILSTCKIQSQKPANNHTIEPTALVVLNRFFSPSKHFFHWKLICKISTQKMNENQWTDIERVEKSMELWLENARLWLAIHWSEAICVFDKQSNANLKFSTFLAFHCLKLKLYSTVFHSRSFLLSLSLTSSSCFTPPKYANQLMNGHHMNKLIKHCVNVNENSPVNVSWQRRDRRRKGKTEVTYGSCTHSMDLLMARRERFHCLGPKSMCCTYYSRAMLRKANQMHVWIVMDDVWSVLTYTSAILLEPHQLKNICTS